MFAFQAGQLVGEHHVGQLRLAVSALPGVVPHALQVIEGDAAPAVGAGGDGDDPGGCARAGALSLLRSPQPPGEAGLAALLNDLDAVSDDVVLVLDDYHVIDARDVQDGMAFLLEYLPPQIHLVIGSRADPALPLARSRGRGELVEIRAADLRFTPGEAAAYLNEVMGLALTATDLDGPDIARELVVSLNTVRTHTKNIYAKLGVNNRRAAVRRARELDLSRTGDRQPR